MDFLTLAATTAVASDGHVCGPHAAASLRSALLEVSERIRASDVVSPREVRAVMRTLPSSKAVSVCFHDENADDLLTCTRMLPAGHAQVIARIAINASTLMRDAVADMHVVIDTIDLEPRLTTRPLPLVWRPVSGLEHHCPFAAYTVRRRDVSGP